MPQNKPMKIQWITVNGRQVPLVLPQVWNEGKQEWVVTSEYNPLPTADTNVKAELESIKQTQQQILQRLNQPIDTLLTGRKVEEVILFPRQVRTSTVFQVVNVPSGAIGLVVTAVVHGVTGTFDDGQGFRLNVTQIDNISAWGMYRLATNRLSKTSRHHVYIYPGLNLSSIESITDSQVLGVSMIPHTRISISMEINGTFNGGEGFDCELRYYWFY